MALNIVELPYSYFPDFSRGRALWNAQIFVGVVDTDPEIPTNQKQVTVRQEDGTEVQIAQPVRTSSGGVPTYNGSPVTVLVDGAYSIKVLDRVGAEEYYSPDVTKGVPLTPESLPTYTDLVFDSVADMISGISSVNVGNKVRWQGYYSPNDGGGNVGIVKSGAHTEDGGHIFSIDASTFIEADFSFVEPRQFGLSESNTGVQNTQIINNINAYQQSTQKKVQFYIPGTYTVEPLSFQGENVDFFWWEAPNPVVTIRCESTTSPAIEFNGVVGNSFQYITFKGLRVSSDFICIQTRFTEFLDLSHLNLVGNGEGLVMSVNANETDIKPKVKDILFGGLSKAFRSGDTRIADVDFKNWVALNCGTLDDYIYDFGYVDGGTLDKIQVFNELTARIHGLRMLRPIYVDITNLRMFENRGIGVQISSPKWCTMDDTCKIVGTGQQANDTALRLIEYAGITSEGCKISPQIHDCYGAALAVNDIGDIDFSGLNEKNNCRGSAAINGFNFINSTGCKIYDTEQNSNGNAWLSLDNSTVEIRNPRISGYATELASRLNSPFIKHIPSNITKSESSTYVIKYWDDVILVDASSAPVTVTLPPSSASDGTRTVIKTDTSANIVSIAASPGDTIDGLPSKNLSSVGDRAVCTPFAGNRWTAS